MYGTQAGVVNWYVASVFENDVKMYGTQATKTWKKVTVKFENDVKMYGTQAGTGGGHCNCSLRMM